MRTQGEMAIKYPQIRELKPGESIDLPRPQTRNYYVLFYSMAKLAGIRVSLQTIDDKTVRVTRVSKTDGP